MKMDKPNSSHRNVVLWEFWASIGGVLLFYVIGMAILIALKPVDASSGPPPWWGGILIMIGFTLLGIFLGGMIFNRFGRPFADVVSATQAVSRGDLSVRIPVRGPKSIQEMAENFNSMTGKLADAEQRRRSLTADIAHELRNPLHVIQGNLEGMIDGVYEPSVANLEATLAETRLLARLVNDLQTLSLAENGQLPLHPIRFPLTDLLEDVVTSFSTHSTELGVDIQYEADANPTLFADYDRLDQALSNLVTNALRHTPRGGRITLRGATSVQQVQIFVSDTGPGIPDEDIPHIFDRFWKGDRARTRDGSTGSGLGLPISRQLVRAHGGEIEVTSRPGQGASFIVTLPLENL